MVETPAVSKACYTIKLEEFVDMVPLTPGNTRIDLRARYYQTEATVTPGEAKGALNFTIEYR